MCCTHGTVPDSWSFNSEPILRRLFSLGPDSHQNISSWNGKKPRERCGIPWICWSDGISEGPQSKIRSARSSGRSPQNSAWIVSSVHNPAFSTHVFWPVPCFFCKAQRVDYENHLRMADGTDGNEGRAGRRAAPGLGRRIKPGDRDRALPLSRGVGVCQRVHQHLQGETDRDEERDGMRGGGREGVAREVRREGEKENGSE
jgi:hypothetical protein